MSNTLVKFAKGSYASYNEEPGLVYFDTTNSVIRLNGVAYGLSSGDSSKLEGSIKNVSLGADQKTLTFTKNDNSTFDVVLLEATQTLAGLMSASDKVALDTLAGADTVAGSLAKAEKDLNAAIDAVAEDVAENKVTAADASVVVTPGSTTAEGVTTGTTVKVNVKSGDNALKLDATNGLYVDQSALTGYQGSEAIAVSDAVEGVKTISLSIDGNDKVLTQGNNGLLANINLTWTKENGLKLIGKNNTEIAVIPASDFIKDGMLDTVELVEDPEGQTEGTYIKFTFNTDSGKNDIFVNVTSLIDIYTASNGVKLEGNDFLLNLDSNSEYASISDGKLLIDGIDDAIATAAAAAKTAVSAGDASLIKVEVKTPAAADGHVEYVVSNVGLATDADLTTLEGRVDTAEQDIDSLEGRMDSAESAIEALEDATNVVKAVTVNEVEALVANNKATVTIDAANIKMDEDYANTLAAVDTTNGIAVAATDTINEAIAKLDKAASINASNDSALANRVTSLTGQSSSTYTANGATNYISAATSLNNADVLLDSLIKTAMDALTWDERD